MLVYAAKPFLLIYYIWNIHTTNKSCNVYYQV